MIQIIPEFFYTLGSYYPFVIEEEGKGPSKIKQVIREKSKHYKVLSTPVYLMARSLGYLRKTQSKSTVESTSSPNTYLHSIL